MSASKDLFMEIRVRAEMDEDTFRRIPEEVREQMRITRIEASNFREIYRNDPDWKELNKSLRTAIDERAQREAEIRLESRKDV